MPEDVWRFIMQAVPLYWLKGAWLFSLELLRSDDNSNGSEREREREREREGKKARNKWRETNEEKRSEQKCWWRETRERRVGGTKRIGRERERRKKEREEISNAERETEKEGQKDRNWEQDSEILIQMSAARNCTSLDTKQTFLNTNYRTKHWRHVGLRGRRLIINVQWTGFYTTWIASNRTNIVIIFFVPGKQWWQVGALLQFQHSVRCWTCLLKTSRAFSFLHKWDYSRKLTVFSELNIQLGCIKKAIRRLSIRQNYSNWHNQMFSVFESWK